ncbi:similar to RIKEN cDNA 1810014F10 gene (predicted), isoform CRA_f [Rattus norvegicus]|uniref:Similar to RIKEN cDNA 1810014F10 gene (Predicted), isoform CRA_f n=1 Tax=Rattus norvegicus TaxID=10116 RepID=A6HXF8_RAT|nr:similar to RIKEN cDNA 1810014F10 gene (predicted), isoform CRA_f [Rattus norvegicus]
MNAQLLGNVYCPLWSRGQRSGYGLMFGKFSTYYLCYVRPRSSDATWLLPALNPQLSHEVKEQLGLSVDRNRKRGGT